MLLPTIAESCNPEKKVDCNNYGARKNLIWCQNNPKHFVQDKYDVGRKL